MRYIVTCPQCNEVNPGTQMYCTKCQANLIDIPRRELAETEPYPSSIPLTTEIAASRSARSKKVWLTVGIIFSVLCSCAVICIAAAVFNGIKVGAERAPIELVLDTYMKFMVQKDIESAYNLFSPRAKKQIPLSELQEMLDGNNFIVIEGYQSLEVVTINISQSLHTNPNMPQGTVATVTGTIIYAEDIQGSFNGVLEKVDDRWLLDGMHITVPPSKIK